MVGWLLSQSSWMFTNCLSAKCGWEKSLTTIRVFIAFMTIFIAVSSSFIFALTIEFDFMVVFTVSWKWKCRSRPTMVAFCLLINASLIERKKKKKQRKSRERADDDSFSFNMFSDANEALKFIIFWGSVQPFRRLHQIYATLPSRWFDCLIGV